MRRPWQIAGPILLVFCCVCFAFQVENNDADKGFGLKVSIASETLQQVPSCLHSFGQVELQNTHPMDGIEIHSIQVGSEETLMVTLTNGDSLQPATTFRADSSVDHVPQQLHVSSLPSEGSISLGPGQVVIVPVTFLPMFPSEEDMVCSDDTCENSFAKSFQWETPHDYQRNRNNLDQLPPEEQFQVRTRIIVDTSRGVMQVPLSVSSVRKNPYGLPDVIRFLPWQETGDPTQRDCFDVYMNNPTSTEEMVISEILVSRPDLVTIELDSRRIQGERGDPKEALQTNPAQVIREWMGKPLVLPPDSMGTYVATVCTCASEEGVPMDEEAAEYLHEVSTWVDLGGSERGMGFLQIRSNEDTLFVVLEQQPERLTTIVTQEIPNQTRSRVVAKIPSPPPAVLPLQSFPDMLDFLFVGTTDQSTTANVTLHNSSPQPIRLKEVEVQLSENDESLQEVLRHLDVSIVGWDEDYEIQSGETTSGAFSVSARLSNLTAPLPEFPHQHIGSLFVRGILDVDWIQGAASDNVDAHFELEIPLSVSLMDGRVEMTLERTTHPYPQLISTKEWDSTDRIVSALFFPMERIQSSEGSESPMVSQNYKKSREIVHDLRVMSHTGTSLELQDFLILDENGEEVSDDQSACAQFNASRTRQIKSSRYADYDDIGFVTLQYKFDESTSVRRGRGRPGLHELPKMPTTCFLSIVSKSPADVPRRIPLIVFPPDLEVSSSATLGESISPNIMSSNEIMIGFKKLLAWCQESGLGKSFIETLKDGAGPRKASQNETKLLEQYLETLNGSSLKRHHRLRPILLNVGAVENGETVQVPVRFTNRNPVPISVTVEVPEVEGMSLTIGRDRSQVGDGNSLLDYLPKSTSGPKGVSSRALHGRYAGHPLQGLRQFLLSNNEALAFAAKFPYRNAISENKEVTDGFPMLRSLYSKYAHANFQRSSWVNPFDNDSPNCHLFSSTSGNVSEAAEAVSESLQRSPMMISDDKRRNRVLKVCAAGGDDKLTVAIPPGASARFEVTLRAPDQELLEDDINKLLATGLVISTNFGQIMPILVAFEAVQGQISAKKVGSDVDVEQKVEAEDPSHIVVPLKYNWDNFDADNGFLEPLPSFEGSDHLMAPSDKAGVPLYLSSSFSRNVKLQKVSSCNPWFEVQLQNGTDGVQMEVDVDTHIGSIHGLSSCLPKTRDLPSFPSFYQCVVNLLSRRQELQPPQCGSQLAGESSSDVLLQGLPNHGVKALIQAFELAILTSTEGEASNVDPTTKNGTATTRYSPVAHGGEYAVKSGRKFPDGYVSNYDLKAFAMAWFAWKVASEKGLTRLSSSLQATIEYNVTEAPSVSVTSEQQSLTLALHSTVESILEEPRLFESHNRENGKFGASFLEFPPTLVGTWAALKIPLRNPLSVPVRVRLAAAMPTSDQDEPTLSPKLQEEFLHDLDSPYVQSYRLSESQKEAGKHLWWDGGGAFFQADGNGDVIRSQHNVTIRAGTGAQVRIINPSIHSSSAFINGCSSRCGVADDYKQTNSPQDPKLSSVIGAGSAAGIVLTGHQRTLTPDYSPKEPYFQSGGVPMPGSGPSAFAIPFSAMDELVIPPHGIAEVGPVFFRPTGRYSALGCDAVRNSGSQFWNPDMEKDCMKKEFESMLFLENSLTGVERVVVKGRGMWEHLYFQDPPPRAGFDTYGDIELRNGRSTLIFSGSGTRATDGFRKIVPTVKHVLLRNGGDVAVAVKSIYLTSERGELRRSRNPETVSLDACSIGSFRLLDCWESNQEMYQVDGSTISNIRSGFVLEPGQSRSIFVENIADCSVKEEFVTLVADLSERRGSTRSSDTIVVSGRGRSHRSRYNGRTNPFGNERVSLEVGYSMGKHVFPRCLPVNVLDNGFAEIELPPVNSTSRFAEPGPIRRLARGTASRRTPTYAKSVATFVAVGLVAFAMLLLMVGLEMRNGKMAKTFSADPLPLERADSKGLGEKKRLSQQSLWNAAFRCLARADPSPTELQALGREQTRQVVAGRYRVRGGVPPTALSTRGTYVRDRSNSVSGPYVKRQERGSGTEKVRTLSDAMFRRLTPNYDNSARSLLPAGLDWRVAYARGIIEDKSGGMAKVGQTTKELLRRRDQAKKVEVEQNASMGDDDAVDDDTRSLQDDVTDDQTTDSEASDTPTESDQQAEPTETEKVDEPVADIPEPEQAPVSTVSDKGPPEPNKANVSAASQPTEVTPSSIPALVSVEQQKALERTKKSDSKEEEKGTNRDAKAKDPEVSSPPETVAVQDDAHTTRSKPSTKESKPGKEKSPESGTKAQPKVEPKATDSKPLVATSTDAESSTEPSKPATKETRNNKKASTRRKSKKNGNNNNSEKESRPPKKGSQSKKASKKAELVPPAPTNPSNQGFEAFGGVAPPPGLSPPPGFGTGAPTGLLPAATASSELPLSLGTDSATLGDMLSAALNSDLGLPVAPPPDTTSATSPLAYSQFGAPSASDMLFGVTSALPTVGSDTNLVRDGMLGSTSEHLPSGGDPALERLLHDSAGRRNGFDVMDFLDSILDDGDGGEGNNDNTADLLNGDALFQPNNPWAAESRASAYGISMDPSAEDTDSETSPSLYPQRGLGLRPFALTPMAGEEEEDDRAFSFYAQLTEED
eukprot:Nitzschia sp. Nitz4//scaffold14_size191712//27450//35452//NITZ4_001702-RA/size191712-snap-gene-0.126-mRNA-1//1//CDS//3329536864//4988//frame0